MKKNLLTVLILALLLVNIVLTSVMMVSVMSTNKKTAQLVRNIAMALDFEWTEPGEEEKKEEVSLADTEVYNLTDSMTIPLSDGGYMICNASLSMNKKHKEYKKYKDSMADMESLIKDEINTVVAQRTENQCRNDLEGLKAEILEAIQKLFDSDFIYNVAIMDIKFG
ncbi:MAG: flagellar basal body-associated FliL family protein [Roseburia sp.]|nr:flagellar basal body-associated FliL family protein [Roseburia sp.]